MEHAQEVVQSYLKTHKKLSKNDALIPDDIGESLWKRSDKIIIVPDHLHDHVRSNPINRLIDLPN